MKYELRYNPSDETATTEMLERVREGLVESCRQHGAEDPEGDVSVVPDPECPRGKCYFVQADEFLPIDEREEQP